MDPILFAGSANPGLAGDVVKRLGLQIGRCTLRRCPDTELNVEVHESVRGRDVYIIQPTSPPVDQHLIELLFLTDACRRAGASRVTGVVPYFGYSRQDRRARNREAMGARLVADLLKSSGIERTVAVDLHTASIEGFFGVPLEHLSAVPLLAEAVLPLLSADSVILAADLGAVKLAADYSQLLHRPIVMVHKIRINSEEVQVRGIASDVYARSAILVDDMITTGGTIEAAARAFIAGGGDRDIVVVASHGLLTGTAGDRLRDLPIKRIFVTDSVAVPNDLSLPIETVTLAPLLAEAIARLHKNQSMNELIAHR
jgi:ribose-phosphate pyrophosphokinase